MSGGSRISRSADVNRISEAVSRPGIDPRVWVSYAVVTAILVDEEGPIVDVLLMPDLIPETARIGAEYAGNGFGIHFPLSIDDEVLVEAPDGDPDSGLVVSKRLHSPSDPPPQQVIDNPTDIILVAKSDVNIQIITQGNASVNIEAQTVNVVSGDVNLGEEQLEAIAGVLNGEAVDPFTGATHFVLGNASTKVKAVK